VSLTTATKLFEVGEEADPAATSASFTFGAEDEATENPEPVQADAEGNFTYNLTKEYTKTVGIDFLTELLNVPVCVTLYNCAGGGKVPICSATLDLSSFVYGEVSCGGELPLQELPQEAAEPITLVPDAKVTVTASLAEGEAPVVTKEESEKACIMTVRIPEAVPCPPEMLAASKAAEGPFLVNTGIALVGRTAWCKGGTVVDDMLSWEAAPVERFYMTEKDAEDLKHLLRPVNLGTRPGGMLSVEVARYLSPDKTELTDPFFENYHGVSKLKGLEGLVEPGDTKTVCEATLIQWKEGAPTVMPVPEYEGKSAVPEDLPEPGLCPWVHYKVKLTVEISLSRPLIPTWEAPPTPQLSITDLLPKHPPAVKITAKEAAKKKFRECVKSVVANLADEYSSMFPGSAGAMASLGDDIKRKQFVFELNRSGSYYHLKEKLKEAVVQVVREFFSKVSDLSDVEKKSLYDDLYVFLIDEMHAVLRGLYTGTDPLKEPAKPPVGDCTLAEYSLTKLKKLADEQEVNGVIDVAKKYHQQRLILAPKDVEVWYEHGAFCMRNQDLGQAEEALREGLLVAEDHFPTLMALVLLLMTKNEFEDAEVYAQTLMKAHGGSVLVWMILTLLYTMMGKEKEMINCEYEMNRLIKAEVAANKAESEVAKSEAAKSERGEDESGEAAAAVEGDEAKTEGGASAGASAAPSEAGGAAQTPATPATPAEGQTPPGSAPTGGEDVPEEDVQPIDPAREALSQRYFLELAVVMLDHHTGSLAANVLGFVTDSVDSKLCLARAAMIQKIEGVAFDRIVEAMTMAPEDYRGHELIGHVHFEQGRLEDARDAYQIALDKAKEQCTLAVFLRLGKVYLELNMFEEARRLYEVACEVQPCASTWLGAGIANYRINNPSIAEECLSEANLYDYLSPKVWGYLALVLIELGRVAEAEQALGEANKNFLDDASILAEIGRKYYVKGMYRQAEGNLRLALKYGAEPATRCMLGDARAAQKDLVGAKEEYLAALEADSSVEGQQSVLKQLIDVCAQGNESSEVAQYTAKLNALST